MGADLSLPARTEFPLYFVPVKLVAYVPVDNVRGRLFAEDYSLEDLIRDADCHVSVPARPPMTSLWVPVAMTGRAARVFDAYQAVDDRVEEVDDVVLTFHALKSRHALLRREAPRIGADSAARIHIPDDGSDSDVVTLEGRMDAVAYALEMLHGVFMSVSEEPMEASVPVPGAASQPATWRGIADNAGVSVTAVGDVGSAAVRLSGAADGVEFARNAVEQVAAGKQLEAALDAAHSYCDSVAMILPF